jgi:predicted O-methyltransferase YrrM
VDVERFAAELPGLFDDFPRSEHPRGRRFDDVIRGIPNLAAENVLALLNLAASLLGSGESYVEVGTYYGASLIGAMRGNSGDFVAIDAFVFGETEVRGRRLPPASRPGLEESLHSFGSDGATILEGDAFEVIEGGSLGNRRVGVYYYDGAHGYEDQLRGLRAIEPWLAEEALLIVDDAEWDQVARATRDYLAGQPRARQLFDIPGEAGGYVQWWDGVAVLAWRSGSDAVS